MTVNLELFIYLQDADIYNHSQMESIPGAPHFFRAEDKEDHHYLNRMIASKNLGIKISCAVMLIHNLSAELVNGLQGLVQSVEQDSMC